jgi:sugar lactone lactonase YvrE
MDSIPSFFHLTTPAAAFPRVFSSLRARKWSLPLCGVLALMLCGARVGAHAQTAHFVEAQSVVANAANNGINNPGAIAVDESPLPSYFSGTVFIADPNNKRVLKETPSVGGYIQTVVANAATNGLGSPQGVAEDGSGNVYIADTSNKQVLKETLSSSGYTQSVVANAATNGLGSPQGVAVDGFGNVYIADNSNNRVLKETFSAGGYIQSVVANAANNGLSSPQGIAVDGSGNVYIADTSNNQVLNETLSASGYTQSIVANKANNGLSLPSAVAVDFYGNVYIVDENNNRVLKETPSAGSYTQSVIADSAMNGLTGGPGAVALDYYGNVYIADSGNNRVLEEAFSNGNFGAVNVASTSTTPISVIFTFDTAGKLGSTEVVTQGATGLDFTDAGTGTCEAGTAYTAGETCTVNVNFTPQLPGARYGAAEMLDGSGKVLATGYVQGTGVGPQVNFLPGVVANLATNGVYYPGAVSVDGSGNVYIADPSHRQVLKETLSASGYTQSVVANAANNGLGSPQGVAVDGAGNVYIADNSNNQVLKETLSGGNYTQSVVAIFPVSPYAVAVDGSGNVYITLTNNYNEDAQPDNVVRKATPSANGYTLSTVAVGLINPVGAAVDGSGNLYVVDSGDYYNSGFLDGRVLEYVGGDSGPEVVANAANGLVSPYGVAVDGIGNLYITDVGTYRVLKETPPPRGIGSYTQSVVPIDVVYPSAVAVDGNGNVYIADASALVVKADFDASPSLTFAPTAVGATSTDSPRTVTLENVGNAPLRFPMPATGDNPSIATNFTLNSGVPKACPLVSSNSSSPGTLAANTSCLLPISFSPTMLGSLSGSLVLTDNALNVSGSTQSIHLSGTSTGPTAVLMSPSPGSTLPATSATFTWLPATVASAYDLHLSAVAPGGYDLYVSGHITGTSATAKDLPINGGTIYARLYTIVDGVTYYNDYTYTAMSATLAQLIYPAPGSMLTTSHIWFDWTPGTGVTQYDLHLSAIAPGGYDLGTSGPITRTYKTFSLIPLNGETIYARLYSIIDGEKQYVDYTYTAK